MEKSKKELIRKIEDLSLTLTDRAIAKRLGMSKDQVYRLRKKYKIFRNVAAQNPVPTTQQLTKASNFKPSKKTLIFTAWEMRVKPSKEFIECLNHLANYLDAEKICSVIAPEDLKFVPPIIENNFNVVTNNVDINENLQFEYVPTHALVTIPTQGFKSFSHKSTIIPALIKDMQTLPSIRLPKLVSSTGSVGYISAFSTDYDFIEDENDIRVFNKRWSQLTNRRGGNLYAHAKHWIKPSALIVDILDDKIFHARYVTMHEKDRVYDLNKVFYVDGRIENNIPKALVLSDIHEWNKDKVEFEKSMKMIDFFQPEMVFLNDYFDAVSISHHDIHKSAKAVNAPDLESEAESAKITLREICDRSNKVMYLQSNHCNFVLKWLDDSNAWNINRNYTTALELQLYRIRENKHPIIKLLDLDSYKNLEFIAENSRYFIGNTLIEHGHTGISGRRASFYELVKLYGSYVCGHFHSARQYRDGIQVGKIIRSDIEYASTGASNWICANALIHQDESKQLLFVLDGKSILDHI